MRRLTSMFAVIAITSGACIAFGDKEKNPEKPKVTLSAHFANEAYAYLSNFPAKDVMGLMNALDEEVSPQIQAKKEKISISKEYADTVLKLLLKDGRVKLTVALQEALTPPAPQQATPPVTPPTAPPTPPPEKKEEKK